ncbi:MAG: hypothetical protein RI907_3482 [Pseudomonadota bacterium]|jgi:hypothetical protein
MDLHASDLRPFLPAQDFELSKQFYLALGAQLEWSDAQLALFNLGGARFYVQRYHVKAWAENCMLHITVQDAARCHAQIAELLQSGRFPGARVAPPKLEPYGALVTYVWDPVGVLLHLAEWQAS